MTRTVFKRKFAKCKPKIVTTRDFKNVSNEAFRQEVLSNINTCNTNYNSFTCMLKEFVNLYVPQKRKLSILC